MTAVRFGRECPSQNLAVVVLKYPSDAKIGKYFAPYSGNQ